MRIEGEEAVVGITHVAQEQLGDVVFVDLPEAGTAVSQYQPFGSIDSVKTASDLFSPVSGEVSAVNENIADDPSIVNSDPYGEGWLIKVIPSDLSEMDNLMTADQYGDYTKDM